MAVLPGQRSTSAGPVLADLVRGVAGVSQDPAGVPQPWGEATQAERRRGHPLPSWSSASSIDLCAGVRAGVGFESRILPA